MRIAGPQGPEAPEPRRPSTKPTKKQQAKTPEGGHFGSTFDPPRHNSQKCSLPFPTRLPSTRQPPNTSEPQACPQRNAWPTEVVGGVGGAIVNNAALQKRPKGHIDENMPTKSLSK